MRDLRDYQCHGPAATTRAWLARVLIRVQNFFRRLWRNPFRSYVHSVVAMDALIRSLGFTLRHTVRTFVWDVVVYEKDGGRYPSIL